ncbi:putative metalloendopeptidase [Galbibacter orientalis DSM 19592]|uniref:Putative metalloendopeptidase n=1 Tax=Galbibacter orientalis DSM 19592 TaxID=926559 RepID=I3C4T5_9FLAO|nr:M13 family metallopeptidase [Galbibacter orientalis]EIJ38628.1 putative metalloendopeptidase [Galbibacter orientalis DSM 19592]
MKFTFNQPVIYGLASVVLLASCKTEEKKEVATVEKIPGINLQYMDTTASPNNNFFRFVNGKWLDETEIPADKTTWGSFNELRENTDDDALSILNAAKDNPNLDKNSDQAKAVRMFESIMDTASRDEQGVTPLKPYLEKIDAISNKTDLQTYLTEMTPSTGATFFRFGVGADAKDSNKNVASLGSGRLGLPDRDYYLDQDDESKEIREKYIAHITRMLQFVGYDEAAAAKQADQILALETKLAEKMLDKVERRDPKTTYNPTAVADLQKMVPSFDWKAYLDAIGASSVDTIDVSQVAYTKSLETVFSSGDVEAWKSYLRWSLVNSAANRLTQEMDKADWEFYSKELRGAKEQEPLEKRALQTVNWSVGEALGKLYVDEKFPPEAKAQAKEMIANVIKAYEVRINALPWMDAETKKKAVEKLEKTTIKVGYPDEWKDYSSLAIKTAADGGSYFQNSLNVSQWDFAETIDKLGKPVDKSEWYMSPQTVNAYYNPSYNEIVFPAAILQPPFFNFTADAAVNYGGIGAVIGHEISHGFDDSGADFDADGNLVNWWTEKDLTQFNALGDSLAAQYSRIEVLPEVFINGKFTLGENIGDLGGVNAAYDGLQMHLKEHGNPGEIDGFTPEQRFFMSWATVWRTKMRDEALKNRIKTDPHSPGMYRATQPLLNIDAFYKAFDIKEGDGMYLAPEERIKIW